MSTDTSAVARVMSAETYFVSAKVIFMFAMTRLLSAVIIFTSAMTIFMTACPVCRVNFHVCRDYHSAEDYIFYII